MTDSPHITHHILGDLEWNDQLGWWEGEVALTAEQTIGITVSPESGEADRDLALDAIAQALIDLQQRERAIRYEVAASLLELYNDVWREQTSPLATSALARQMRLTGLTMWEDLTGELFYDDGGLFAGHTIIASLSADGSLEDATIAG